MKSPKGPETFLCVKVCTIFMVSFYLQIFWGFFSFYKKDLYNFNYAEYFKGQKMHYRNLYQIPDETQHILHSQLYYE